MARKSRKVILTPSELRMDLGRWVAAHMTIGEQLGPEWTVECPKCHSLKLAVHIDRKAWQCWRCNFRGWQPIDLVQAVLRCGLREAMEEIASGTLTTEALSVEPLSGPSEFRGDLPEAPLPPGTVRGLEGITARYAEFRGIDPEYSRLFGLCSVRGDGSRSKADRMLTGRLLIPVWDLRRSLVYWVARSTLGQQPKTVNCPSSEQHEGWGLNLVPGCAGSGDVVVGIHLVQPGDLVIVVEGPIDAVVCGPGFVATLGSHLSRSQAAVIARSGASEAVILFDPDAPGEVGGREACRLLSSYMPTRIAQCPVGEDPAMLGRDRALAISDNSSQDFIAPLR